MNLLSVIVVSVLAVLRFLLTDAQLRGTLVTTTETRTVEKSPHQTTVKSNRQQTLDELLESYDPRIPPNYEEDFPVQVLVQLHITHIHSISESNMDYKIGMFLRQSWTDRRLMYKKTMNMKSLELDSRLMDSIWVPDLYIANEKDAKFHTVTVPNKLMHIYPDGLVKYSIRISATLQCNMDLSKYPLDSQICDLMMESYAYSMDTLEFRWNSIPVLTDERFALAQFRLGEMKTFQCDKEYNAVNYTCIALEFEITRNVGYYLTQIYIPSMLIVGLSWVSFWLDMEAVPARISLGLLTVLTMTTQSAGARSSLPKVSYVKGIDIWMATCLLFVFAALIEFAVVNVFLRVDKRRRNSRLVSAEKLQGGSEVDTVIVYEDKENSKFFRMFSPSREKARSCDRLSRTAFPVVFFVFNLIYWSVYTLWSPRNTTFS